MKITPREAIYVGEFDVVLDETNTADPKILMESVVVQNLTIVSIEFSDKSREFTAIKLKGTSKQFLGWSHSYYDAGPASHLIEKNEDVLLSQAEEWRPYRASLILMITPAK